MRCVYGAVTLYRVAPFQTLPLTHMLIQAPWAPLPVRSPLLGNLG